MSKLRAPLKELLDAPLPELQVQRIWRRLQAPAEPSWIRRRLPLSAAACAVVAGVALAWVMLRPAAPLAVSDVGALAPSQLLGGDYPTHWPLTDGSRIELGGASQLEVVQNAGTHFALELKAGHAGFDVQPGGPRRWSVQAGALRVEVVGTSFTVDRDARGVAVQVRHGVVLVRGPSIAHGAQRLRAGERVFVDQPKEPAPSALRLQPSAASSAASEPDRPASAEPACADHPSSCVAQPGAASDAGAALSAASPKRSPPHEPGGALSADQSALLLRQADQARQQHDSKRAIALLERVRRQARGSVHAALASWTLARIRAAREPARAAVDIAEALQGSLPDGLRESARARLVEAHALAGETAAARAAAHAYRIAYPEGRYLQDIERWTREP